MVTAPNLGGVREWGRGVCWGMIGPVHPSENARCPKRMAYGPCGGVRADLSCEMAPQPCPFAVEDAVVSWSGPAGPPSHRPASILLDAIRQGRPVVLTDFTVPAYDAAMVAGLARILDGSCDAVLVGEHQDQPDFPPTLMAQLLGRNGVPAWLTLTCRDRNRIVLEQELAGLALTGADGVLCVTGDGRAPGIRPDVTQVFDLDGTRLAALAASRGLAVAVPESPSAKPRSLRPARLVQKQRAGAHLVVLNHAGGAREVSAFLTAAADLGLTIPVLAAVAVYTDARSAQVLSTLPGVSLDEDRVERVLGSRDPRKVGVDSAVEEALEMLSLRQVAGVDLSGLASAGGVEHVAEVKAEVGRRIKEQM
jgi:methylenetetrahydrofolate reductase (NADPH)